MKQSILFFLLYYCGLACDFLFNIFGEGRGYMGIGKGEGTRKKQKQHNTRKHENEKNVHVQVMTKKREYFKQTSIPILEKVKQR